MFDPFEKRISRDIRNRLSGYFLQALNDRDRQRFDARADALGQEAPDASHRDFIEDRLRRYRALFDTLAIENTPPDPARADRIHIAALLFEGGLFFECHEWLEEIWQEAAGPAKKALQALIRTAGAFALHEAGRTRPAASSAQKARAQLREFRDHVPAPFTANQMMTALESILRQ